jgi:anti-sigma regulatory factor (Ser/Thr protein kinase)
MKDLALHILDIAQNSIAAGATLTEVAIDENLPGNQIGITIRDNGKGIPPEMLAQVTDPYVTSRTTRKVGMGLPLFRQNAEQSGGWLKVESEIGKGTEVKATFMANHIDLQPWGDISGVIILLITANPQLDFLYIHRSKTGEYTFDTREIKTELDGVSIDEPEVRKFLKEMLIENLEEINACKLKSKIQNSKSKA